jgi:hypothetical protein
VLHAVQHGEYRHQQPTDERREKNYAQDRHSVEGISGLEQIPTLLMIPGIF